MVGRATSLLIAAAALVGLLASAPTRAAKLPSRGILVADLISQAITQVDPATGAQETVVAPGTRPYRPWDVVVHSNGDLINTSRNPVSEHGPFLAPLFPSQTAVLIRRRC